MKIEIIPALADKKNDVLTLQEVATASFTAMFGPYHDASEVKKYTDEAYQVFVLIRELQNQNSKTYFLKLDDKVIGYLKLNWKDAQTDAVFENAMQLQRIYLLPEYWNQHLGGYLMDKALDKAKKSQVKTVWLGVWEHNDRARHFYERYGFKKAGEHVLTIGKDHQKDYWYALDI
ncbi:Ribosomal protein S18 acetylase RimI [Ligilactobacillus sp. WC1T17]|uniref:Ribosomal protein S18 acetylase RimI n=1 Tax=Ligilactobacillus ruminis TaxID=1623 RepID=A0ABY1ADB7_9LACO|nr:Ribosomal protein S18 acetylase RimI [Ligilactobacillus ruminis]